MSQVIAPDPQVTCPQTAVLERIPLLQKVTFSVGVSTENVAVGFLTGALWMPYFNIGLGISPTLLGIVLMILLIWNAFIDPFVGNISDNARTRWGRRKPFLIAGAILTACVYPLFWNMPATLGEFPRILYLIGVGIVFFTCFSLWAMPYYALQLELTPNYDERTRLASWMTFFGKVSALLGSWLLAFLTGSWFINPATGKGDIVIGMKTACWIIAGLILVCGLLPAFFVKERHFESENSLKPREPLWQSIRESASCKPLWSLIGITFLMVFGSVAVTGLGQYVGIYYLFHGDLAAAAVVSGWKGSVIVVTGILLIPAWSWLAVRFDKRNVLFCMIGFTLVGHVMGYFFLDPANPYLTLIPGVFESSAISAVWLLIPSMKADTADYDELQTGRRREGSLNAFFSWFFKASLSCATGASGLLLELSGFSVKHAEQVDGVISRMIGIYILFPAVLWALALLLTYWYPLDRAGMAEIRSRLEARRGVV
ncbi:glycoside/pentoside/hexuronide:cation symporter, GPH family [Terrimicrobium sacchariphilum]|uniref:Glycoside/pentoside/hexuronide:cation symporter, GPH family n=1 Tax=Terrimicrobium sacchariphilum TaxID=690879 RepID=A0A146G4B9_TERSA|nr:MFS transporter [Terrimicrobium sacchariphilum]GAT32282.1 glycoside/pentoside/hexuronide:cation symporter, GPH family [Terrimicrobium sacchariphilum]